MNALSFEIGGKTAIFKKPDVNAYAYFTYNNIHKPALLGILGAIIGLGGYTKLYEDNRGLKKGALGYNDGFPEFYEKLKHLKVSIIPLSENKNGYFTKKIQTFNNSVGYASFEQGGNLVVREQWLENPKWKIIILDDGTCEYEKLKDYLLNAKAEFIPYLGKNDHIANIDKVEEIVLKEELYLEEGLYIDSLFIKEDEITGFGKDEDKIGDEYKPPFVFSEFSPVSFQKDFHFYEYKELCFTNCELDNTPENTFSYKNKNYVFL